MKRLTPHTIIPPEFYVERGADRQLIRNLGEMGRPAYILVARQMGKTNLLLHTKWKLETPDTLFVYVDLSSSFHDERECFRQIIDTALDVHPSLGSAVGPTILANRNGARLPNREHDIELRALLGAFSGRLVIVLDEIDSLTNAPFSDRVFAHIRSVYFSRVNYPSLSRVTYVLSGVVEPNEIIKDKKISPFNIGEKIYLDDFTIEETQYFCGLAKLDLSEATLARLQYWTGGNPRMTWDLCSAIEDRTIANGSITESVVDELVEMLYLRDFNHTPIDNIRQLVKDSPEIRNSVWTLVSGNGEQLSDTARTRLYLSGIIKSNFSEGSPTLKNEVIARALSRSWLEGVAVDHRALFNGATERFERGQYAQALELYRQYFNVATENAELQSLTSYQMGMCHYHLTQYREALEFFKSSAASLDPSIGDKRILVEGVCHLQLGELEDSLTVLEGAKIKDEHDETHFKIRINIAAALLKRASSGDVARAITLLSAISDEVSEKASIGMTAAICREMRTIAFFNLSSAYKVEKNDSLAKEALEKAAEIAQAEYQPAVRVRLLEMCGEEEKQRADIIELVDWILANQLVPKPKTPERSLGFDDSCALVVISWLWSFGLLDSLDRLLKHLGREAAGGNAPVRWLMRAAQSAFVDGHSETAVKMFVHIFSHFGTDAKQRFETLRWLVLLTDEVSYREEYIGMMGDPKVVESISIFEMRNFRDLVNKSVDEAKWTEALKLLNLVDNYRAGVEKNLVKNYLVFDAYKVLCLRNLGDRTSLRSAVEQAASFARSIEASQEEAVVFNKSEFVSAEQFITMVQSEVAAKAKIQIRRETPKYGRNMKLTVKYLDGRVLKEVKFKRVESDIAAGRCSIVQ